MRISACYIVKNEEKNLERSINSIKGVYDELIVVDTGSTDNTLEIAESCGAKCFSVCWKDDFSYVRNYALSLASGDWIIFLDADQYYLEKMSLRQYMVAVDKEYPDIDALHVMMYNDENFVIPPTREVRIFRKKNEIYYTGAIHEHLIKENGSLEILNADCLVFFHTGYKNEIIASKLVRNLRIIEKDIQANGDKEEYYYYIAECYFGLKKYEKAIKYIKKAFRSSIVHVGDEPNYYHILIESMRQCGYPIDEMEKICWQAINMFPEMPEFYGEQGMILSSKGCLREAHEVLNKCVIKYNSKGRSKLGYGYIDPNIIEIIKQRLSVVKERIYTKDVIIVVPIYKAVLSPFEKVSLQQLNKVLYKYPRVFIAPESLEFDFSDDYGAMEIERFPDYYFYSIASYSRLMLEKIFYERFLDYNYVLVYQTDAFVFSDKLLDFCRLEYDYIGAPIDKFEPLWHAIGARVGNGGISLRRVSSACRMLNVLYDEKFPNTFKNLFMQWEDCFWGYCGNEKTLNFKVPSVKIALSFAVQQNVCHAHERIKNGWHPFACHGWNQGDFSFWRPVIEEYGYCFSVMNMPVHITRRETIVKQYLSTKSGVNLRLLWGMHRELLWNDLTNQLRRWCEKYPLGHDMWKGQLEELTYLCRAIEAACMSRREKIECLYEIVKAIEHSIACGSTNPLQLNALMKLIPILRGYDFEPIINLVKLIENESWNQWTQVVGYNKKEVIKKDNRFIVAKAMVIDEAEILRDFIAYTLTFADALLLDMHISSARAKLIVNEITKDSKIPVILYEEKIDDEQIFMSADMCIELSPTDILLSKDRDKTVRQILGGLDSYGDYNVEVYNYAPWYPYAHNDKFILDRPLVQLQSNFRREAIIRSKRTSDSIVSFCSLLHVARFRDVDMEDLMQGILPLNVKVGDIHTLI